MSRSRNDQRRDSREKPRSDTYRRKERNFKRELAEKSSVPKGEPVYSQQQKRALERLLSGIGTPEPRPIVPDDFQVEALQAVENG